MAKKKRQRPSKPWFLIGGIVVVIAISIVIASWVFLQNNQTGGQVKTKGVAPKTVKGGVGGQGTPEFNNKLEQKKNREADFAAKNKQTYVPPVINQSDDDLDALLAMPEEEKPEEVKINPPKVRPERRVVVKQPVEPVSRVPETLVKKPNKEPQPAADQQYADERREALGSSMINTMKFITEGMNLSPVTTTVYAAGTTWTSGDASAADQDDVRSEEEVRSIELYPGDVLYAVVDQFLNSDAPVPAFRATIVSGKFKNAILLGTFERVEESLSLSFVKMRLPSNEIYGIKGYGVDPKSTDGRLASDVNRHTLTRWGAVIAATMLEGWGDAVEAADTTTYTTGETVVSTAPDYRFGDQMLIASGEVGSRLSDKALDYFDRPPTVKLRQGYLVGVVIMDVSN
jgi:intracellular multiplication protein IcmE